MKSTKFNTIQFILLFFLIGIIGLVMPTWASPATEGTSAFPYKSSISSISIGSTIPDSPQYITQYSVTPLETDMVRFRVAQLIEFRENLTSETDAPLFAQNALARYGGLPQDAILVYDKTIKGYQYNATTNEIIAEYPIITQVQYTRFIENRPVVGQGGHITISLGERGELLEFYKIWRTVIDSGDVEIIPVSVAIAKLNRRDVLNDPKDMFDVNITNIKLGYYEKGYNETQEILEPVWIFYGSTSSGNTVDLYVYARQFANFTASTTNVSTFQPVQFSDTSETTPTKRYWDFGDGTNSTEQNPAHAYNSMGNFTVTLTAWNELGSDTISKTNLILVSSWQKPLNADFNATPANASIGDTIQFYDASDSSPNRWLWELGDGSNSTKQNPTHAYAASGNYSINLTAWNSYGSDKRTMENYIRIFPDPKPVADFTSNYSWYDSQAPVTVAFSDASTGNITGRFWDFGDGTNTTEQNPVHVFLLAPDTMESNYQVNLTVTDIYGRSSSGYTEIYVKKGFHPDFRGEPRQGYAPLNVTFSDLTPDSEYARNVYWDFGDGNTYEHYYWDGPVPRTISNIYLTPGKYNVTLVYYDYIPEMASITKMNTAGTTTNEYDGHDAYSYYKTKEFYIIVTAPTVPEADFSANTTTGKAPLAVNFTDLSSGNSTGWAWTFGDSAASLEQNPIHVYPASGNYTVSLTTTNPIGSNTTTKIDYITVIPLSPPVPGFSGTPRSGKAPLTVVFNDTSAGSPSGWNWDLGDGTTVTEQDPVHIYTSPGNFTVSLTATNADGSNSTTMIDYVAVLPLVPPVANFTANMTAGKTPLAVAFTDASTGFPASWAWAFGDGSTSADQNPVYVYTTPGQFTVSLKVTNPDGSSTATREQFISGSAPLFPVAEFTANRTSGKSPLAVGFTDQSTGSPAGWHWTFGDGATSAEQNPAYIYAASGTYTVSLEVTNPDGSDTMTKAGYITVSSVSAPVANFTGKPTCGKAPLSVTFTDSTNGSPTAWYWNFGDGTNATQQNPVHIYTTAGKYTISLTATNTGGSNTSTRIEYVTVSGPVKPPVANFNAKPTSGKAPLSVNFTDTSSGSPTGWNWSFGDRTTATEQHPNHTYTTPGKYTVILTATNAGGNTTKTRAGYIMVKAIPPPAANFVGKPPSGKAPLSVVFNDTSTGSPTSWNWNFGDGSNSTEQHPVHQYISAGKYTVALTASNAGGNTTKTRSQYITVSAPRTPTPTLTPTHTCTPTQCDPHVTPQVNGTTENGKVRLDWNVITNPCLQGYKVVISKNNPNPKYPDDGYMFWITDRNTNSSVISTTDHYNDGDFGGYLQPGQKYYFSITAVYSDTKVPGNVVELVYPSTVTPTPTPTPTATCTQNPCEPYTVPLVNGTTENGKVRLDWDVITNPCLQGYKVVISKNNPNPKYPDDGYMFWITDRNTHSSVISTTDHYNGGDFGGYLQPGQTYYFSITAVYPNTKVPGNVVQLAYRALAQALAALPSISPELTLTPTITAVQQGNESQG